jgi:hypothetical protein
MTHRRLCEELELAAAGGSALAGATDEPSGPPAAEPPLPPQQGPVAADSAGPSAAGDTVNGAATETGTTSLGLTGAPAEEEGEEGDSPPDDAAEDGSQAPEESEAAAQPDAADEQPTAPSSKPAPACRIPGCTEPLRHAYNQVWARRHGTRLALAPEAPPG